MQITKQNIDRIDTQGMWNHLMEFPRHWQKMMDEANHFELSIDEERINKICFAGMGSSSIGADLLRAYTLHQCPYPIQVIQQYKMPSWVDENTLFIACSYSGNTEETLSALDDALQKKAQVIALTSGGQLLVKAQKEEFDYVKVPGGIPARAALAYNFVPLYKIFQRLGYLDQNLEGLVETLSLLEKGTVDYSDISSNEALTIANELFESLPIIYSDASLMRPVNLRWCNQIRENAKMLAYGNFIPEMTHNEIVGWEHVAHLTGRLNVIMLKDKEDSLNVSRRMEIVKDLVMDQVLSVIEIETYGQHRLARLLSLIQLGDWVSYYLAILNEVDPTPTAKIDLLKSRLAEI